MVNKKLTTVLLGFALVFVSSTAIVKAITTKNAHNSGVIALVGDSNMTFASAKIVWEFNWLQHTYNGYTPLFMSYVGAGIRTPDCVSNPCSSNNFWQIKFAETWPKVKPDVVVVNLGINDAKILGTSSTKGYSYYGQKIDWLMQKMPIGKKVLWSNLPCNLEPPEYQYGCNYINNSLNQAKSRWSNLIVLDWATIASTHPEYMDANNIHYSIYGQAAYAKAVVDKLDTILPLPSD